MYDDARISYRHTQNLCSANQRAVFHFDGREWKGDLRHSSTVLRRYGPPSQKALLADNLSLSPKGLPCAALEIAWRIAWPVTNVQKVARRSSSFP